jgi:hypothetical protein
LANHQLRSADKPALTLCLKASRSAFNVWDECYHLAGTLFHIIWNIVPDELEHYSSLSKTICFVQNIIAKTGETEDGEQEKGNGLHCEFYRYSARKKSQKESQKRRKKK